MDAANHMDAANLLPERHEPAAAPIGFIPLTERDEEDDELARVLGLADVAGVAVPGAIEPAKVDALASDLLRRAAWMRDDLDRYARAKEMEIAHVVNRYQRTTDPIAERLKLTMHAICALAERVDFGKKRSRSVAYGRYGLRHKQWRLQVDSADLLLAWAERTDVVPGHQQLVRKTLKLDVPMDGLRGFYDATGELPDGCTFIPEKDEPFAEPLKPERE